MTRKDHNRIPLDPVGAPMICSACGYGLENYEQWTNGVLQGVTYAHGYLPPDVDPNHEINPIPRPADNMEVKGVCDFCISPDPIWTYPCKSFSIEIGMKVEPGGTDTKSYGSVSDWGACQQCHDDIEADRWTAIAERNLDYEPIRRQEPIRSYLIVKLEEMYKAFRLHRTGPAYLEADGPPSH